jgi:hypothetical protein
MPWDIGLSQYGDLNFTAARDLLMVRSGDLVQQRMMLRLRLPKGSYMYNKKLGSEMRSLLHVGNTAEQQARGASIVTQALRPMDDLTISSITVEPDARNPRAINVIIEASVQIDRGKLPPLGSDPFRTEITVPLAPASGETTARA